MNTKHVLMAMSLPLLFAACTSDDVVNQGVDVKNQDRPTVGDVRIVLGGDVMSRVADPESGEVAFTETMGALLMDTPTGTGTTFAQKYALSNTVATDYPFTLNDDVWSTTGLLLEGNYFFYYPAKEGGMARQKFTYSINENQKAYDAQGNSKRYQPMTDNQMWVSYKGFEANTKMDGEKLEMTLAPAHARVDLNVVYEGKDEVTINKVILKPNTGDFAVQGSLNVTGAESADQYKVAGVDTLAAGANLPALFNVYNDKNASAVWNKSAYNPLIVTNPAFTKVKGASSISVELKNQKLTKGQNVGVTMIVPNTVSVDGFAAEIHTDKGIVTIDKVGDFAKTVGAKNDSISYTNLYVGGKFQKEAMDSLLAQKNGIAEIVFTEKAIEVPTTFNAATTEELDLFLTYHEFQAYEEAKTVTVKLLSDTVALSKASYDLLKANKNIKLALAANGSKASMLNITAELSDDAINLISAKTDYTGFVIAEGATQKMTVDKIKNINNKGTLTIERAKDGQNYPSAEITALYNTGILNVKTPLVSSYAFTNGLIGTELGTKNANVKATAVVNADTTITADVLNYGIINANNTQTWAYTGESVKIGNATTATASQLTVAAGKTVTLTGTSASTITNNGTLTVAKNTGIITNNKTLTVTENAGTINNNVSVITTNGKVTVGTNSASGVINTVADSQTDIETNNLGLIYYAENAFINGPADAIDGSHLKTNNIVYKVAADMTAAELAAKIQQTKVTAIEIANAKLTVPAEFDITKLAALKNISLNGSAEVVANDTLTLASCPVYVSGTNNVVSGTSPINFIQGGVYEEPGEEHQYQLIKLAEGANLEIKTVITGVKEIYLGKNAKVIARTNVYGSVGAVKFEDESASWLGTAFEVK